MSREPQRQGPVPGGVRMMGSRETPCDARPMLGGSFDSQTHVAWRHVRIRTQLGMSGMNPSDVQRLGTVIVTWECQPIQLDCTGLATVLVALLEHAVTKLHH